MWQWQNWLRSEAALEGKRCVTLNLDETPIPAVYLRTLGNVVPRILNSVWTERCYLSCSSHERRIYFTFIMIVCDDKAIQKLLPQLLIVGDGLLTNDEFLTLQDEMPENMYLKRKKTGWNSSEVFSELMRLLRKCSGHFAIRLGSLYPLTPCHFTLKRKSCAPLATRSASGSS